MSVDSNWVEVLQHWAGSRPDELAFRFLLDGEQAEQCVSFGELEQRVRGVAARLQQLEACGERVLLLYPSGLEFITAFLGCLFAGAVAVPAYPPDPTRLDRTLPRLEGIVRDARPRVALTTQRVLELSEALRDSSPAFAELQWLATDVLPDEAHGWRTPVLERESLAFLQYTSGSTGAPKGVMVSHGDLLHNSRAIQRSFGHTGELVGVGWLPLYHDMGLIGKVMQPLYLGRPCTLLSPVDFLARPARWLEAISRYGATTSGGPNFAYELCVRKTTREQRERLDLSTWRVAFVGAEPVREATLSRFAEAFRCSGFTRRAFFPCYGLAEATLMASGGFQGKTDPGAERGVVCVGRPVIDREVSIVDPVQRVRLGAGEVGEVWLSGAGIPVGYWNRPADTAEVFGARLAVSGEGPFLRTGDLGFLRDGALFVTGRAKDLIIIRGRNHYPADIEQSVEASSAALRPGCSVAFGVEVDGEERLVVLAELRSKEAPEAELRGLVDEVCRAVALAHDVRVHAIRLLPGGQIPKTSSGKVQRQESKARHQSGALEVLFAWSRDDGGRDAVAGIDAEPGAKPEAGPLDVYSGWSAALDRLERRNTRYRFDLERDICWDQLPVRGGYLGPTWLRSYGVAPALSKHAGAHALFQWAMALGICEAFIAVEEGILRFLDPRRKTLFDSKSLLAFREEEEKHVRLFRRYAEHLRGLRPELCAEFDAAAADMVHFHERVMQNSLQLNERAHHYQAWLYAIFLEEGSIHLHEQLLVDEGELQPTWVSVHAAHRQEEIQHVATDAAYIEALDLTEAERQSLSRLWVRVAVKYFGRLSGLEPAHRLLAAHYPEHASAIQSPLRMPKSYLDELLRGRAFGKTRRAARYLGRLARAGELELLEELAVGELPASPARLGAEQAGPAPDDTGSAIDPGVLPIDAAGWRATLERLPEANVLALLRRYVSERVAEATGTALERHRGEGDVHLLAVGVDSVVAVELAARFEADLGFPVGTVMTYDSTLGELANGLRARLAESARQQEATLSDAGFERSPFAVDATRAAAAGTSREALVLQVRPVVVPQPFFCASGLAGMVRNLTPLCHLLGEDRAAFALQQPGLLGDEAPPRSIPLLAQRWLKEIRAVQPRGPYLLGGYSFGGLAVYELAQQLVSAGEEVSRVVLLDTPLPDADAAQDGIDFEAGGRELLLLTQLFTKTKDPHQLEALSRQSISEQMAMLQRAFASLDIHLTAVETSGLLRMYVANIEATFHYRAQAARFPVTLFRAAEDHPRLRECSRLPAGFDVSATLGWERVCTDLQVEVTPGDHIRMLQHPHVAELAAVLRQVLRGSRRSCRLFSATPLNQASPYARRAPAGASSSLAAASE